MPKRIPVQTVVVQRNGKNFIPEIGKPFDFTDEELEWIKRVNPLAVRHLVNEEVAPVAVPNADQDQGGGRRGRGRGRNLGEPASDMSNTENAENGENSEL